MDTPVCLHPASLARRAASTRWRPKLRQGAKPPVGTKQAAHVCKHKQAGRTNRFRSTHGSRVAAYGRHPLGLRGGRLQRASRLKEPQALRYNTRCPTRVRTTSAIANRLTNVGGGACGCLQTASAPQGRPRMGYDNGVRSEARTKAQPNAGSVGRHRPPVKPPSVRVGAARSRIADIVLRKVEGRSTCGLRSRRDRPAVHLTYRGTGPSEALLCVTLCI